MGKYSAEELHYMDDSQVGRESSRLSGLLAELFSNFGEEPTDWIYLEKNCCFVVGPGTEQGEAFALRRDDLRSHIVLLPYDFFERYTRNPRGTAMLVLHEVAHAYLDHRGMLALDLKQQHEFDAWALAAQWYRSSDLSRNQ